jgi:hypothetical protein
LRNNSFDKVVKKGLCYQNRLVSKSWYFWKSGTGSILKLIIGSSGITSSTGSIKKLRIGSSGVTGIGRYIPGTVRASSCSVRTIRLFFAVGKVIYNISTKVAIGVAELLAVVAAVEV